MLCCGHWGAMCDVEQTKIVRAVLISRLAPTDEDEGDGGHDHS